MEVCCNESEAISVNVCWADSLGLSKAEPKTKIYVHEVYSEI